MDEREPDAGTAAQGDPAPWGSRGVSPTVYGPTDRQALSSVLSSMADDVRHEPERVAVRRRRTVITRSIFAAIAVGLVAAVVTYVLRPDYRVLQVQNDGSPVTWRACTAIHYVVNVNGSRLPTAYAIGQVQSAVHDLERASGLRFVYDGPTGERPSNNRPWQQPHRYGAGWAPVLIAWSGVRDRRLPLNYGVFARTLSHAAYLSRRDRLTYVSGQVVMNRDTDTSYAGAPTLGFRLRHELGHLVGLGHVRGKGEVMNPSVTAANRSGKWGRGDRAGLRKLGAHTSCAGR